MGREFFVPAQTLTGVKLLTTLGQLLQMAAHASDWGDSLNQGRRGGNQVTMVMMFVGGVLVLMFDRFLVLFLPYDIYEAGVFCFRPNPYSGKAVKGQGNSKLMTPVHKKNPNNALTCVVTGSIY